MKKFLFVVVILTAFFVTGCTNDENKTTSMSKEEIITELKLINNNLINVWNDAIVKISWYTLEGTDETGKSIDIKVIMNKFKLYYDDLKTYDDFIKSLDKSYEKIQTAWTDVYREIAIIYTEASENNPMPKENISYRKNIDKYEDYQSTFNDLVDELSK